MAEGGGNRIKTNKQTKTTKVAVKTFPQPDEMCNTVYQNQLKYNFESNSSIKIGK